MIDEASPKDCPIDSRRSQGPPAGRLRAAALGSTGALALAGALLLAATPPRARAASGVTTATLRAAASVQAASGAVAGEGGADTGASPASAEDNQLESAAHRAGETGRRVAMSLIALGFAIAAIVLAFRRDFKEAIGVFAIGVVAVLLAQEAGVKLVENLVHALVGS